jgi:histidyl-tRNA synthetase
MSKPSLPQGTRDFGPQTVRKRNFIFQTIRNCFELYGFQPLETPAMENLETLTGKYGEEGDKLIFKILNNGLNNPAKEQQVRTDFEKILQGKNSPGITERALRYDLTIPFARYVAMHQGELVFPFRRYQLQPVWRADKPQRGRYREFYQCDADVVGSNSLLNEVDLANIYIEVFRKLNIGGVTLRINHRRILASLAEAAGGIEKMTDITTVIDKLDKIGISKVREELNNKGLSAADIEKIEQYLAISGTNAEMLDAVSSLLASSPSVKNGLDDLKYILTHVNSDAIRFDPSLARGLNYYTGTIFEVHPPATVKIGSIGGGGRYDDLTGLFGVPGIPGVGISFGVDRIYDVMEELSVFPADVQTGTEVLLFNLGEKESDKSMEVAGKLRAKGIRAEVYHEFAKMDRQFKYAEKKSIPFVLIIGEKELESGTCNIKKLSTGEQQTLSINDLNKNNFNL